MSGHTGIFSSSDQRLRFEAAYNMSTGLGDGDTKVIANYDIMFAVLKEAGLISEMRLPVDTVGVHIANRGGKAMSGVAMQAKGAKIVAVGVSHNLCLPSRAVCFAAHGDEVRERMHATVAHSKLFGTVGDPRFGSVGCSHLNQFLHAVRDRAIANEDILKSMSTGNVIDTDRLYKEDDALKQLCLNGLLWSVVSAKAETAYPQLPHVMQQALNVEHHIAEGETWEQQLVQIAKYVSLHQKRSASGAITVNWDKVTQLVRSSCPPHVKDLVSHVTFLKKYGGGGELHLCKELVQYLNHRMPPGRKVTGSLFDYIGKIPMTNTFAIPRMANAVVKVQATHPGHIADVGTILSKSDVESLSKSKKDDALKAEKIIDRAISLCKGTGRDYLIDIGDFEVKVLLCVLGKTNDTLDDLTEQFINSITGTPENTNVAVNSESASDKFVGNIVQFGTGGAMDIGKMTVMNQGFTEGMTVVKKTVKDMTSAHVHGHVHRIQFIASDGQVSLVAMDTECKEIVEKVIAATQDEFLNEWKPWGKEVKRTVPHPPVQTSPEWKTEIMKSVLVCAIDIVGKQHNCDVLVQNQPFKGIVAKSDMLKADTVIHHST